MKSFFWALGAFLLFVVGMSMFFYIWCSESADPTTKAAIEGGTQEEELVDNEMGSWIAAVLLLSVGCVLKAKSERRIEKRRQKSMFPMLVMERK
jgi:hypothetical protein